MKHCQERVGKGVITYSCSLPPDHDGPHYAHEVASSRMERERWESGAEARATMAEFQGVAPPIAAPNPVPGTDLSAAEYRRANPPPEPGTMAPPKPAPLTTPVEAPCSHPFNQVTPVDGGMYCAVCQNVLETRRLGDSLRDFVGQASPVADLPIDWSDPDDDEAEDVPDRFAEALAMTSALNARMMNLVDGRGEAQEALSTLYRVLIVLANKHPNIITYDEIERMVEPIARWVNNG